MGIRSFYLKRLLARAAKLHEKGSLSDYEYAAFAIWVIKRLQRKGASIRPGALVSEKLSWSGFLFEAGIELKRRKEEWPKIDFKASQDRYGPYNMAVKWLITCLQGPPDKPVRPKFYVRWTEEADKLVADARVKLSAPNRIASYVELWLADQRERWPHLLSVLGKVLFWILTVLTSFLLGRCTAGSAIG